MDFAAGLVMKGRLWRDFLYRALQRLWTGKELAEAEAQLALAADPSEAAFVVQNRVKAGSVRVSKRPQCRFIKARFSDVAANGSSSEPSSEMRQARVQSSAYNEC